MLTKSILMAVFLAVPVALSAGPAAADPGKNESGMRKNQYEYKEEYKREYRSGDCKYESKEDKQGYKEERKCKGGPSYAWSPPPWAPAHGYRYRDGGQQLGRLPLDLDTGRCNRELLGSLLGAAAGGLTGSRIGDGRGQLAAVAGGTLLGFLIGGTLGRNMDEVDQNCVGQALEHAGDGQQIAWNNPQTGAQYQIVPTRTAQGSDGRYCREYTATSVISGRNQQTYGRACRQPDGSWQIVQR